MTVRQKIVQLLKQEQHTAKDISRILGIREKEVYEHLVHVQRSMGNGVNLVSQPARCLNCEYVFRKRERLTTPGRCPVCRSERVSEPVFAIT